MSFSKSNELVLDHYRTYFIPRHNVLVLCELTNTQFGYRYAPIEVFDERLGRWRPRSEEEDFADIAPEDDTGYAEFVAGWALREPEKVKSALEEVRRGKRERR